MANCRLHVGCDVTMKMNTAIYTSCENDIHMLGEKRTHFTKSDFKYHRYRKTIRFMSANNFK